MAKEAIYPTTSEKQEDRICFVYGQIINVMRTRPTGDRLRLYCGLDFAW
jgi:hypothetical protein